MNLSSHTKVQKYRKCFITVGTTKFDRLCKFIISSSVLKALKTHGCEFITFQIGNSNVEPEEFTLEGIKFKLYRFKDSILSDIAEADLVISHAGAGSCLEVLEANKPLLVVVNEDLMDNHQIELAEQLHVDGYLYFCTCDTLTDTLLKVDFNVLKTFPKANPELFIKQLDNMIKLI